MIYRGCTVTFDEDMASEDAMRIIGAIRQLKHVASVVGFDTNAVRANEVKQAAAMILIRRELASMIEATK